VGIRHVWQHQVPKFGKGSLVYSKCVARVAARYALMSQHIISLVQELATRAKHIDVVLRAVNPQPPCRGEFPSALMADALARLTACLTNPKMGRSRDPILAND